jgi:membrane fusion protein, heavy metal efflux system
VLQEADLRGELFLVLVCACAQHDAPAKQESPARVAAPVTEAQLSTVTLTAQASTRIGLQTAEVKRATIARTRRYPARVEAVPGTGAAITAPVAGVFEQVGSLVPGRKVKRGEVLLRLKPLVAVEPDTLSRSERDIEVARSRVDAAKTRATRLATLAKDGAASQRSAEEAAAELAVAQADLDAAKSRSDRVRQAPFASDVAMPLRAPDDGTVLRLSASPGQIVAAGAPLVELTRTDRAWVRVSIYAGEHDLLARGQPATISTLGGKLAREITPIDAPAIADATGNIELVYAVDNADASLTPGQRVLAALPIEGTTASVVAPSASLVYDIHGGTWAYVQTAPNTFARRRVELRDVVDGQAVIARGLEPGMVVVITGAAELYGAEFGSK